MQKYTTDEIIRKVRQYASIPKSSAILSDNDIIDLCTNEMHNYLVPKIMSVREDYFVKFNDYNVSDYRQNQSLTIPIPYDAVGSKLRDVAIKEGNKLKPIPRIYIENLYDYTTAYSGYYIENSDVKFTPYDMPVSTIRMYYIQRPNDLVLSSRGGMVREVRENNQIVLSRTPSNFSVGDSVNIIKERQPFNLYKTATIVTINGTLITLDDNTDIQTNSWVTNEGESVVPQLPVEAHAVLIQMGVCKALEAMGDMNNLQIANEKLVRDLESLFVYISPRVDSSPTKIVPSSHSITNYNQTWGRY